MSASDCYNLALMLYKQEGPFNYNSYAAQWFDAACERLDVLLMDETPFSAPKLITFIGVSELNIIYVNTLLYRKINGLTT